MIHVIATIELNDGARQRFIQRFRELEPKVHAEEGCIEYGAAIEMTTSLPAQEPVRDNVVMVIEKWESVEALEKHLVSPHMQAYRQTVGDLIKGISLRVLQPCE